MGKIALKALAETFNPQKESHKFSYNVCGARKTRYLPIPTQTDITLTYAKSAFSTSHKAMRPIKQSR